MIAPGAFLLATWLVIPYLAWASYRHLSSDSGSESTTRDVGGLAIQALAVHGVVLGLGVAAVASIQLRLAWLSWPSATAALVGLLIVIVFAFIAALEARRPLTARDHVRARRRRAGLSKPRLATMSAAAVAEEYAYRGALHGVLETHLSPLVAAAVAAAAFGPGHLSHVLRGALLGVVFAASMQLLRAVSGALALPRLCHLAYALAVSSYGGYLTLEGRRGAAAQQVTAADQPARFAHSRAAEFQPSKVLSEDPYRRPDAVHDRRVLDHLDCRGRIGAGCFLRLQRG